MPGYVHYGFTEIADLADKNIVSVSCGNYHTFLLDNTGKAYSTGSNWAGQLGLGNNLYKSEFTEVTTLDDKNVVSVSCGRYHTVVLDDTGKMYSVGWNYVGQLGIGYYVYSINTFTEVTSLSDFNISSLICNEYSTIAITDTGVYTVGYNMTDS